MAPRCDEEVLVYIQELIAAGMSVADIILTCKEQRIPGVTEKVVSREFDITDAPRPRSQLTARRPGAGRPLGSIDRGPRQPRSDRGLTKTGMPTAELAERAKASYALTGSLRETARELDVSPEYVRRLVASVSTDGNRK